MRVRNHDFESEERTWCLVSRTQILRWPGGRRESISTSPPLIRPLINLVRNNSYIMAQVWLAVPTSSPSSLRRVERIARSLLSLISTTAPSLQTTPQQEWPSFLASEKLIVNNTLKDSGCTSQRWYLPWGPDTRLSSLTSSKQMNRPLPPLLCTCPFLIRPFCHSSAICNYPL